MKFIIIAAALLINTNAYAFLGGNANATAGAAAGAVSNAHSASKSISNSNSNASAYQHQWQGQHLNNRNTNKNANNSSGNTTVFKTPHQAPSFGLASMFPTAVCQGTLAAGFSFLLGGGAGAGTITIEECMKIETIRVGTYMLQNAPGIDEMIALHKANVEVYCKLKHAKDTSVCPQPEKDPKDPDNSASAGDVKKEKFVSLDWPWKWGD